MAVVLTGDVHHRIPSADRPHTTKSESALAVEYARIAEANGLKVTLFLTGLAARDDSKDARPLLTMESVEVGGHGWDAFEPRWFYRALAHLSGSPHGYRFWQRRTIARTCGEIERFAGRPVRSWRNHAYTHDTHTPGLLTDAGIIAWSDEVNLSRVHLYRHESGLVVLPINAPPDHENMFHGDRTPETVSDGLYPAEWLQRVLDAVELVSSRGGIATIMAHPICMEVVDSWATFEALCRGLARYPSLFAIEAAQYELAASRDVGDPAAES